MAGGNAEATSLCILPQKERRLLPIRTAPPPRTVSFHGITATRRPALACLWLLALAFACLMPVPSAAQEQATQGPAAQGPVKAGALNDLATSGEFDALLDRLQQHTETSAAPAPLRSLIDDLQRYQQHRLDRKAQREERYTEALAQARERLNAGEIERALRHVIDAHGLSLDPQKTLERELVVSITREAEDRAAEAEKGHDWLEALSLYRLLDMLYEQEPQHRDDVERIAAHVRVLQVYAPKRLDALVQQRAERRGDDRFNEQLAEVEHQSWRQRLEGVEVGMLRDAVTRSARQHVGETGFTSLMRGSIDGLLSMTETPAVFDEFEGLGNVEDRQRFRGYLQRLSASLGVPGEELNFLEAAAMIDRIVARNKMTVDIPEAVLTFEMAEGATSRLDDFSSVIWPYDIQQFSRSTEGKFTGIGVQITRRDGQLMVVTPLEGTPAQKAGVKAGDVIAAVDGVRTASWTLDQAVRRITGPEGTEVTLTLERIGEDEPIDIDVRRAEIVIESIHGWEHTDRENGGWKYFVDPANRIGYVRLSQFMPQTDDALDEAVEQMQEQGSINGLVLDLRHNPGGLLSAAIAIADRFLAEGDIVATVDGEGKVNKQTSAKRFGTYKKFPVAVLINRGSASASEIVAGALQDHGRAVVVGARSFGKGSVQDLFPLAGGRSYLKLTTQYYRLPGGRIIHRQEDAESWGIEPDLSVEVTDQQVADLLEFRQLLDVLREPGKPVLADASKPWGAPRFRVENGKREVRGKRRNGDDRVMVEIKPPKASQILELGLDPQLEAALLLLKTRLAADQLALAE